MDLSLTGEEQEFATPLRDFLEGEYSIERQRAAIGLSYHERAAQWASLRSFGIGDWVESAGVRALVVSAFEVGRVCLPLPLISDLYWGVVAPRIAPSLAVDWNSSQVLSGEVRVAGGRLQWDSEGNDGKSVVIEGVEASNRVWLLDSRSSGGVIADPKGCRAICLLDPFMVAGVLPQAEGVKSSSLPSGELWSGWLLVQSARVAGACSKVLSMTVEYLRTRRQFGVPIGGFQAVQQQLAAAVVLQEGMASLIDAACQIHDSGSAQREFSELSAWRFAQMRGAAIVETCLQLHGGIGFTWEYNLHWHLRAVKTLALLYSRGGGDAHYLDSVPQLPTA